MVLCFGFRGFPLASLALVSGDRFVGWRSLASRRSNRFSEPLRLQLFPCRFTLDHQTSRRVVTAVALASPDSRSIAVGNDARFFLLLGHHAAFVSVRLFQVPNRRSNSAAAAACSGFRRRFLLRRVSPELPPLLDFANSLIDSALVNQRPPTRSHCSWPLVLQRSTVARDFPNLDATDSRPLKGGP